MIWKAKEDSPREVRKEDLPDKDLPRTEDLPGKHIEQQTEEAAERHTEHPQGQRRDTDLPEKHTEHPQGQPMAQDLQEADLPERE